MATIAGKKIEVTPMTWKENKSFAKIMKKVFAEASTVSDVASMASEASTKGISWLVETLPDAVTEALALALRTSNETIDGATLEEILDAATEVITVNKFAENAAKAKNLKSLFALPATEAKMDLQAAEAEIRAKLESKKPQS